MHSEAERKATVKISTIAIDGPSASGKSTISRLLAERLGYRHVDTGAMYRALTWLALQSGIADDDEDALAKAAKDSMIELLPPTKADGRIQTVLLNGTDVTWQIRTPQVDAHVSQVSRHPNVREVLVEKQRRLAEGGRVVMEGRDIGTVVLPDADLKVYLVASERERARRRQVDLEVQGNAAQQQSVMAEINRRDTMDSQRAVAPLRPAPDAHIIDTDGLTIDQVLQRILRLVESN